MALGVACDTHIGEGACGANVSCCRSTHPIHGGNQRVADFHGVQAHNAGQVHVHLAGEPTPTPSDTSTPTMLTTALPLAIKRTRR
jgi:hypothetical protein